MISTQTFISYPEFSDNGTNIKPEAAKYSNGYVPSEVLPAEHLNYFLNGATKGVTDLNAGVSSIEAELNNVVTAGGETPNVNNNSQVINAINYLINKAKTEAILEAHPVGSLYWSSQNTNPGSLFGGTWTQIKDKFILAAGDTYSNGATGGAATFTLTTANLPSHTHSFTPRGTVSSTFTGTSATTGNASGNVTGSVVLTKMSAGSQNATGCFSVSKITSGVYGGTTTEYNQWQVSINVDHTHSFTAKGSVSSTFTGTAGTTGATGSGTAVNKMPPYIVKYCFERTA